MKRFSAPHTAMFMADDPAMPAPAGALESVVKVNPRVGTKKRTSRASSGRRYRDALSSAFRSANVSSLL